MMKSRLGTVVSDVGPMILVVARGRRKIVGGDDCRGETCGGPGRTSPKVVQATHVTMSSGDVRLQQYLGGWLIGLLDKGGSLPVGGVVN